MARIILTLWVLLKSSPCSWSSLSNPVSILPHLAIVPAQPLSQQYVFLIRRDRKPVLRHRPSFTPRRKQTFFRSKRLFRSSFYASWGNMRKWFRWTRVHLLVQQGPEELVRDEGRKLVPPVRRTGFSHLREWCWYSPFEGNGPLGGHNIRFHLRRKFGCWPGGQWTRVSWLSPIDGHQLLAKTLFIPTNGNCIAASGSWKFFATGGDVG